jgi:hypothetical protein
METQKRRSKRTDAIPDALSERTSITDRAGTTRTLSYDMVGRQTADTVTAVGAGAGLPRKGKTFFELPRVLVALGCMVILMYGRYGNARH